MLRQINHSTDNDNPHIIKYENGNVSKRMKLIQAGVVIEDFMVKVRPK